jgi:hypothetical protein
MVFTRQHHTPERSKANQRMGMNTEKGVFLSTPLFQA